MSEPDNNNEQGSSLGINDILFIVFRHKFKIIFFFLLGFVAAGALWFLKPPLFESKAKILIKYVKENRPTSMPGNSDVVIDPKRSVVTSEIEILQSMDLAIAAARAVGADKILAAYGGGSDESVAAGKLLSNFKAESGNSDIISVSLAHPNPQVAQTALVELIEQYFHKHYKIYLDGGSYEFLQKQTDQVRGRLSQTEEELRKEQTKAGIISLVDAKTEIAAELSSIRKSSYDTEAELVEKRAQVAHLMRDSSQRESGSTNATASTDSKTNSSPAVTNPSDPLLAANYQRLAQQLGGLKSRELDYLSIYKEGSKPVTQVRQQITELEKSIKQLGFDPSQIAPVATAAVPIGQPAGALNLNQERARIAALEARAKTQSNQLSEVTQKARLLDSVEDQLRELQRRKQMEEEEYRYFQTSLEKAKIDQALDSTKLNNINVVQEPSKAGRDFKKTQKFMLMAFAGTASVGFILAFLIELVFDPSVKRAREVENKLKIPVLTSIPSFKALRRNGKKPAKLDALEKADVTDFFQGELAPWEEGDPMLPYYEALRDRIVMSYNGDNHKPKVVGLTSCNKGAGVTRLATGLAAALSRDVQRNVLLIGLQSNKVSVSSFEKGRPAEALPAGSENNGAEDHSVHENLYSLATTGRNLAGASVVQSFSDLLPKLKVSDYDFIVFDLPPISQTSGSLRLASQMERTIMVVEAEKTDKRKLERAARLLASSRAKVSTVFNKSRSYGPKFLQQDI